MDTMVTPTPTLTGQARFVGDHRGWVLEAENVGLFYGCAACRGTQSEERPAALVRKQEAAGHVPARIAPLLGVPPPPPPHPLIRTSGRTTSSIETMERAK